MKRTILACLALLSFLFAQAKPDDLTMDTQPASSFLLRASERQTPTQISCLNDKQVAERIVGHLKLQFPRLQAMDVKVIGEEPSDVKGLIKVGLSLKRPQDVGEQRLFIYVTPDCSAALANPTVLNLALDPQELLRQRAEEEARRAEEEQKRLEAALKQVVYTGVPTMGAANAPITILEYSDFQ
jgi:hypothetical protein